MTTNGADRKQVDEIKVHVNGITGHMFSLQGELHQCLQGFREELRATQQQVREVAGQRAGTSPDDVLNLVKPINEQAGNPDTPQVPACRSTSSRSSRTRSRSICRSTRPR